jgi:hypothetical protein
VEGLPPAVVALALTAAASLIGASFSYASCAAAAQATARVLLAASAALWSACVGWLLSAGRPADAARIGALGLAAAVFAAHWTRLAMASVAPTPYGTALFLAPVRYAAAGLTLYADVASIYPPGPPALLGGMLGLSSANAACFAVAVLLLPLLGGGLWVLRELAPPGRRWLAASLFLLAGAAALPGLVPNPNRLLCLPVVWVQLLLVVRAAAREPVPRALPAASAALAFVSAWLRWDFAVMTLLLGLAVTLAWRLARGQPRRMGGSPAARRALVACGWQGAGFAAGLLALLAWLGSQGTLSLAWAHMVDIPLRAAAPYRWLPVRLPGSAFDAAAQFWLPALGLVLCAAALAAHALRGRPRPGLPLDHLLVLTGPLVVLPYATGRFDADHTEAFLHSTAAALSLAAVMLPARRVALLAALVTLVPALPDLASRHVLRPRCGGLERDLDAVLADCRRVAEGVEPRSVFAGQLRYDRLFLNHAVLYLLDEKAVPATAFIEEDPGVQTSCEYGDMVVADLREAPRPMLAFLDARPWQTRERGLDRVRNCGRIEAYLGSQPYRSLGTCRTFGRSQVVRLYE